MASNRRIEVEILARDNSSRVFDHVANRSLTMAQRFNNGMTSMSKNLHRYNAAMNTFNRTTQLALAGAGYMIARFTTDSIKQFNDFERQHAKTMGAIASNYDKTTQAQAKFIKDSQKLKEQSLRLGTVGIDGKGSLYNPQQISYAQTTLVKAGAKPEKLLSTQSIPQIVQFAGGNDLQMEQAAEFAIQTASMFNIPMEKWGDMLDKITRTADISTIDVPDIFNSIKYAGGIASALSRPLEDVLAVIALMGNVGLKGSMAGTGLQAFLTRVLNPVGVTEASLKKAPTPYVANVLKAFISESTTKDGKFKPLTEVTGTLDKAMESLTDKEQAWFSHKLFGLFQMKAGFGMAKFGGGTLQSTINDIKNNAPGTNKKKWDLMLDSSYGKWTALGNVWSGIKTDVGYRLSPLTNTIADELFKALANKGNYKIDFTKIQKAIDDSGNLIADQYGKEIGEIVKKIASLSLKVTRSGTANAPLAEGIASGLVNLLGGDLSGAIDSFGNGLDKANTNIDKLPPELQDMSKEIRNAIIALTALSAVNFAAKVADSIATIWRYSIGKMITTNMNVAATSVLIDTGLVNGSGAPIYRQGTVPPGGGVAGGSGGSAPVGGIVGANGQQISSATRTTPPGSTILGSDGRPISPAAGTTRGAWRGNVRKGLGIASWVYAIGEMTGINNKILDRMGVQGNARKNVDSGRNILNWGLTAKFIDSLLLKNAGTNAIKSLITKTIPGAASGVGSSLGGLYALPVAVGLGKLYRESQRTSETEKLIAEGKQKGKSWYWNDQTMAAESGPLADLKALFTGYSPAVTVTDSPEERARKNTEYRKQNKYKYMEGNDHYYTQAKPSRPWYDYLNPLSNYKEKLNTWQSVQDETNARRAREQQYFTDAQNLNMKNTGQPLAWADYNAKMDTWKKQVDTERKNNADTMKQLPNLISNSLVQPFNGFADVLRNMQPPQVNVQPPRVNVNVTVDQDGRVLKQTSVLGDMNDMNNPFKIFSSRMGK